MLRTLSAILSVVVMLGLTLAISASAGAKEVHKDVHVNKNVHVNRTVHVNRNVNVHRNVTVHRNVAVNRHFVVGHAYNGHVWYGHNRHRWHGAWYAYGVGPCWINVDGEWFWNVAACP